MRAKMAMVYPLLLALFLSKVYATEDSDKMRQLYQVRPVTRGVKLAEPARASSVLSKILDWTHVDKEAAIASYSLRPRAAGTLALAEVASKNFNDPAYCADGVGIKILAFEGLRKSDWWSGSDPYARLTARTSKNKLIKSKKGKDHPETEPLSNTHDKKDWNQFFCFPSEAVETIKVEFWDKDSFTKDDKMGEVVVRRATMAEATQSGGKPFELSSTGTITLRFKLPSHPAPSVTPEEEQELEKEAASATQAEADRLAALAEETRAAANAEKEATRKARLEKEAAEKLAAAEAAKQKAAAAKAKWAKLSGGFDAAESLNSVADEAATARAEHQAKVSEAANRAKNELAGGLAAASALNSVADEAATSRAEHQAKVSEAANRAKNKLAGGLAAASALNDAAADGAAKAKNDKYCANRCDAKRVRKDWALMSVAERETYIKAVKKLYDGGVYSMFVRIHQNGINDPYAHGTSAFLPWHRKYLSEFEDALRCLGKEFECVTLPYWDWAEWQYFCNEHPGGCPSYHHVPPNMAEQLAKDRPYGEQKPEMVTSILSDFGGPGTRKDGCLAPDCLWGSAGRVTETEKAVGCVQSGPFAGWEDWDGHCLSRGMDWNLPAKTPGITNRPFTTNSFLLSILLDHEHYGASYSGGYRGALQNEPHNNQHNYLGGHMRSMRSPMDPIFFTHHAMVDKQWARWQDCHNYQRLSKDEMSEDQYEGNAGRTDKKVGFDDSIDVDMPYFVAADPFKPDPDKCAEAAMNSGGECQQCLADSFKNLRATWCVARWDPACLDYCGRDQCRQKCGTGGGHRPVTESDFKLEGDDSYEYMWDNNKLGTRPRDWILGTAKFGDSSYEYQLDAFDNVIGESACHMIWETETASATAQSTATSFLEKLAGLKGTKGVNFKAKVASNLKRLTEGAGEGTSPKPEMVKEAVRKAAKSDMKNQCGLQAKSPMCASLPESQGCTFVCPEDAAQLGDENVNSACLFNALFGAPATSDNLKWSSTCKASYVSDEDFAGKL